jgi:hypothetical protein
MLRDDEFHKLRMANLFGKNWNVLPAPARTIEAAGVMAELIYPDPLDSREPVDLSGDAPIDNPVGDFLAKCADELSLAKNGGAALDLSWSEEVGAAPRIKLSKSFLERSDERLHRVAEKLRTFFGVEHVKEAEEAIRLAKAMRADIRKEFNAA